MKKIPPIECPDFAQTAKLLGDFWILAIIDRLQHGELRFSELQRTIQSITPVTLTNRLKKLESAQIILRTCGTADRQSVCYKLTKKGAACLPIISAVHSVAKCV